MPLRDGDTKVRLTECDFQSDVDPKKVAEPVFTTAEDVAAKTCELNEKESGDLVKLRRLLIVRGMREVESSSLIYKSSDFRLLPSETPEEPNIMHISLNEGNFVKALRKVFTKITSETYDLVH